MISYLFTPPLNRIVNFVCPPHTPLYVFINLYLKRGYGPGRATPEEPPHSYNSYNSCLVALQVAP